MEAAVSFVCSGSFGWAVARGGRLRNCVARGPYAVIGVLQSRNIVISDDGRCPMGRNVTGLLWIVLAIDDGL